MHPHICDAFPLRRLRRPGRLIVLDLRDPWMGKQEAMTLGNIGISVLTRRDEEQTFHTLLRIDEQHEFLKDPGSRALLGLLQRKRRHLRLSLLNTTQHPELVPLEMLSNADLVGVGRMQSSEALRHITKAKEAFRGLTADKTAALCDGGMYLWAERMYLNGVKEVPRYLEVQIRAQTAQHGGATHRVVAARVDDEGDDE